MSGAPAQPVPPPGGPDGAAGPQPRGAAEWQGLLSGGTWRVGSVGDGVGARLRLARQALSDVAAALAAVPSDDLAGLAADAARVVAAAQAAQAAVVLEAHERGVIAASDHPRVGAWVAEASRATDAPVSPAVGRAYEQVAALCHTHDLTPLREALTAGRIPVDAAALVARTYRRLRGRIDVDCWETVLAEMMAWAAQGATARDLAALEEALVGQYGTQTALDDDERRYAQRCLTAFRRDPRSGMMRATLLLDPASEATLTAAIHALSAPRPDPDTLDLDPRTPGARRADALLAMAAHAATADPAVPGTGSKARVIVTMSLADLQARLDAREATGTGAPRGVGLTTFGQPLRPADVRQLACDAQLIPAVLGGSSEILDQGRARRLATPGLLAHLTARDRGCSYPGCTIPPAWTDAHHLIHWVDGGTTSPANMALLCRHHHTVVHRHRHVGTVAPTGVTWTRHDGSPLSHHPLPALSRGREERDGARRCPQGRRDVSA